MKKTSDRFRRVALRAGEDEYGAWKAAAAKAGYGSVERWIQSALREKAAAGGGTRLTTLENGIRRFRLE